jgi:hypothetical protein
MRVSGMATLVQRSSEGFLHAGTTGLGLLHCHAGGTQVVTILAHMFPPGSLVWRSPRDQIRIAIAMELVYTYRVQRGLGSLSSLFALAHPSPMLRHLASHYKPLTDTCGNSDKLPCHALLHLKDIRSRTGVWPGPSCTACTLPRTCNSISLTTQRYSAFPVPP